MKEQREHVGNGKTISFEQAHVIEKQAAQSAADNSREHVDAASSILHDVRASALAWMDVTMQMILKIDAAQALLNGRSQNAIKRPISIDDAAMEKAENERPDAHSVAASD
ncbi:hypothetical protein C7H84_19040 [Burkholderia sp. Nafp2/4-1b]|uniref:hypothetical protein n=1 Tax=Burkholderia sp. Nafp2/4-1b TaxID=2116686 RepID=UPI000EF86E99|nr:hypothetical protein [Burkholderia sp. Nafp2/4-1b]RKU01813.1 hypothetical protein C7H84_19040 [Burkholderia sp. Nafp2/4-1b]